MILRLRFASSYLTIINSSSSCLAYPYRTTSQFFVILKIITLSVSSNFRPKYASISEAITSRNLSLLSISNTEYWSLCPNFCKNLENLALISISFLLPYLHFTPCAKRSQSLFFIAKSTLLRSCKSVDLIRSININPFLAIL